MCAKECLLNSFLIKECIKIVISEKCFVIHEIDIDSLKQTGMKAWSLVRLASGFVARFTKDQL